MRLRPVAPAWGYLTAFVVACVCVLGAPAFGQPGKKPDPSSKSDKASATEPGDAKASNKKPVVKTYDFGALDLNGRMRSPQLLYFLERANEELERASLEKRSFIPHMVRSLEEEAL